VTSTSGPKEVLFGEFGCKINSAADAATAAAAMLSA